MFGTCFEGGEKRRKEGRRMEEFQSNGFEKSLQKKCANSFKSIIVKLIKIKMLPLPIISNFHKNSSILYKQIVFTIT